MSDDQTNTPVSETPLDAQETDNQSSEDQAVTTVNPVVVVDETPEDAQPEAIAEPKAEESRNLTGKVRTSHGQVRPARKARLRIARIDPWSVMKTSMMFCVALGIVMVVAVLVVWSIIEASGALNLLQETVNAVIGNPDGSGNVQISSYVDRWRVLGFTMIIAVSNVVLMTAVSTLMAFLYNLASSILGGLEVTLAED